MRSNVRGLRVASLLEALQHHKKKKKSISGQERSPVVIKSGLELKLL